MTYTVIQSAERERQIREVLDHYSLNRDPEWLMSVKARHNPFPPADERHAITDKEIIRRDMVRAARARKKHG